jgi:hypothetical protein
MNGDLAQVIEDLNVKPGGTFEPLPAGRYVATVISAEIKDTAKGGKYLKVVEQIWDEEYAGRQITVNFNIQNASEKAQQIGRGQLSALAQACGLPPGIPASSQELMEKMHIIKVTVEPGSGTNLATGEPYGPKNEIKGWYSMGKKATPAGNGQPTPKTLEEDELPDFMKG